MARYNNFSPRRLLSKGIAYGVESIGSDPSVWACLTCRLCELVCPAEIPYSELNRKIRLVSNRLGVRQTCTHGGVFEQINALMTRPGLDQDRLGWVTDDLKVSKNKGDTLFFTGCSPYFAAYFGEPYEDRLTASLRSAVRLMNLIGVEPVLLADERCCGHDLLLRGEGGQFAKLAEMVAEQIRQTGAERVLFSCPECLVTLRDDYPETVGGLGVELLHISQLLEPDLGKLEFKAAGEKVTFQDPCRLGRYSEIYNQPREIIAAIPGQRLEEMNNNRERSICCGNTAWIGCDAGTKSIQKRRLGQAVATGCGTLLTACPKCLIHLTCSQQGEEESIGGALKIIDLWDYMASHLA